MLRSTTIALLGALALGGCATPEHTNTLIFGTSTRVAIDVSQEPTGALGATIGYKRHEAVWMPLLANQKGSGGREPAKCKDDACAKFVGETGADGGPAGGGAKDTYSVLATFSGDMSGSAQGAQAKAAVAQYFATGIAARLLAQYGGAAAVSSGASAPDVASIRAAADAAALPLVAEQLSQAKTVSIRLSKTDGTINADKLKELLGKAPASQIPPLNQEDMKKFKTASELETYLRTEGAFLVKRMFETLDK
jgi:hypothetical protein